MNFSSTNLYLFSVCFKTYKNLSKYHFKISGWFQKQHVSLDHLSFVNNYRYYIQTSYFYIFFRLFFYTFFVVCFILFNVINLNYNLNGILLYY